LSSVSLSILFNGKPRGKFADTRGLRQGDPLPSFLFTLVVDILSRMVERASQVNLLRGLVIGREEVGITHLRFPDDTAFLFLGRVKI
jgi:hypothetical protein